MKALLIDTRQGGDWSLDLLFSGLVRNLGVENVVDLPYHMKHRTGPITLTGDARKDWGAERQSLGFAPDYKRLGSYDHTRVRQMLLSNEITHVFLDEKQESYDLYTALMGQVSKAKVVVVAGHDRFWNRSPEHVRNLYGRNFLCMFLDNWRPEYDSLPYAHLYHWSCNFDHLWDSSKREELLKNKLYDICFMGYNSDGRRAEVIDHIERKFSGLKNHIVLEKRPGTMERFVPKSEYFPVMAQSKICLNIRGAAENGKAMRFYEIPYVGSLMLSDRQVGKMHYPFEDGKHCVYFDDLDSLDRNIENLLLDEVKRETIARQGYEHAMKYHTVQRRVAEMLEKIRG